MLESILTRIEFQMSLLLFVALAGYLLASRINQSAVIGEILVGILIGPSLLGLITYTDFIASIAHLGAIILLFVVGLEFKLKDIFNLKYGVIAAFGVIIPWVSGFFLARAFGYEFGAAIFTGTALTATSIAITANVLREMGILQSSAAKAIIGAAVIDDVLSLLALSVSTQLVSGSVSLTVIGIVVLKAALFLVIGAYIGNKYLTRMLERIDRSKFAQKFPESVFIFAMMIAFIYALFAELIALSAIVGAFLAGVALEGVIIRNGRNYKEGAEYLHIIFASIFFVSLGIIADLRAVSPTVIWFLIALTIVAVLSKVIGCAIPAKLQGMSNKESLMVGFGMAPRGEVAMIVALIGLNAGLIKQDLYVTLVLMSLLTTIITPMVLRNAKFFGHKKKI
ncbi:MAG: cation:proton antiporter [Nanoarchaeota archaeon]